jgi:hypothetical protein
VKLRTVNIHYECVASRIGKKKTKKERKEKKKKTDKPSGKPVLCQKKISSVFRAFFFLHSLSAQFNLECLGPFRLYGAL